MVLPLSCIVQNGFKLSYIWFPERRIVWERWKKMTGSQIMVPTWGPMFYSRCLPRQLCIDCSWLCSLFQTAFQTVLCVLLCFRQHFLATLKKPSGWARYLSAWDSTSASKILKALCIVFWPHGFSDHSQISSYKKFLDLLIEAEILL